MLAVIHASLDVRVVWIHATAQATGGDHSLCCLFYCQSPCSTSSAWAGLAVLSGTVAAIHAIPRPEGGMDCGNRAGFSCVAIGSQPWSSSSGDLAEQWLHSGGTVAAICFARCMSLWHTGPRGLRETRVGTDCGNRAGFGTSVTAGCALSVVAGVCCLGFRGLGV